MAEQLRALVPQGEDLDDHLVGVVFVPVVAAAVPAPPHPLTQLALRREGQEGLHERAGVGDREAAPVAPGFGRGPRGAAKRGGQSPQLGLLQEQAGALLVGEDPGAEVGVQPGQPALDGGVAHPRGPLERRALPGEALVNELHEATLLGRPVRGVCEDLSDPLEQAAVLGDRRQVVRPSRRDPGLHRAKRRARQAVAPHREVLLRALHGGAGALHRDDRVVEGRGGRIRRDRVELPEVGGERFAHGRFQPLEVHPVERGHSPVRSDPLIQQRVRSHGGER